MDRLQLNVLVSCHTIHVQIHVVHMFHMFSVSCKANTELWTIKLQRNYHKQLCIPVWYSVLSFTEEWLRSRVWNEMRRHARLCLMFMSGRDVLHNLIKIQEALWALTGRNIVLRYRLETQAWSYHVGCTCMGKLQLHQKKNWYLETSRRYSYRM